MNEKLAKAKADATKLLDDLRDAHSQSDPILEVILLPLVDQAADLRNKLYRLTEAYQKAQSQSPS